MRSSHGVRLLVQRAKVVAMNQACTLAATASQIFFSPPPRTFASSSSSDRVSTATMNRDPNLDAIFEQKRLLRTKVRKDLRSMSPAQRSQEDAAIQNIVLESSWFKSSKSLCAYISCSSLREVDTSKVLSEILCNSKKDQEGHIQIMKKLYVPRVQDRNSNMKMLNISSTDDLIANSMNILEPNPVDCDGNPREDVMMASNPVDLLLLPGLAFDRSGRRLGRSGGYYDMFLTKYQELALEKKWKPPLLVALAYNLQILDDGAIPVTPNDVSVDALVTPDGVMPISPAARERM